MPSSTPASGFRRASTNRMKRMLRSRSYQAAQRRVYRGHSIAGLAARRSTARTAAPDRGSDSRTRRLLITAPGATISHRAGGTMIRAAVIAAFVGGMAAASAQAPAPSPSAPAFDVVSVKPTSQTGAGIMRRPTPGRHLFQNAPLHILIEEAFRVRRYQIVGMPDWTEMERFDIEAAYDPASARLVPMMLQRLLADRFGLRVHRETRHLPIYALVKARPDGTLG